MTVKELLNFFKTWEDKNIDGENPLAYLSLFSDGSGDNR